MKAARAHLCLHLSKCHIVGNHTSGLIFTYYLIWVFTVWQSTGLGFSDLQSVNFLILTVVLQAIKQMYVLVLGLDVLGNPFGLLRGMATGIEDLFYEPYQGAIQGPEEFAEGLALGVRSLFGHAVGM